MNVIRRSIGLTTALLILATTTAVQGQGTVTFNSPWLPSGISDFSLAYFDGISFRVNPYPPQPHDNVILIGAAGLTGHPNNGTPHVEFTDTLSISQYLVFAWTDAASLGHSFTNGAPFGLTSVDLADPVSPSLAPVSMTFNGFHADNSMVTQTFTVGGGGSTTFQTFLFSPDFASDLVRVEIPSSAWAMDNLVFTVPEPSTVALVALGLLVLALRRRELHM
jgi:hypothetical protein